MGADAGVHAYAGVRDGEHRVGAGNRPEMGLREGVVEVDVGGFDRELAAIRHRVARIHDEIHDHLLDLIGIGPDVPQIGCQDRDERDMLADEPAQHLVHLRDDDVEVEHLRLEHLPPAVGEQLARQ